MYTVNRVEMCFSVDGKHLTQYSEILPTDRFKKRLLTLNMHQLGMENKEFTHVVFRGLPTDEHVSTDFLYVFFSLH